MHLFRNTSTAPLVAALAAIAIGGCGGVSTGPGTGSSAKTLLKQTFTGSHRVTSGSLEFRLSVALAGSSTLTQPLSVSLGGPFQYRGKGKLPESDFTVALSGQGKSGSLQIVSTGTAGYVEVAGTAYKLPAATFAKLESSFSQVAGNQGSGGKGTLAKLGIQPLDWLTHPRVVSTGTIGGAQAVQVRAGVDVGKFLGDINTLLQKGSSLGLNRLPSSISAATRAKIAATVRSPTVDLWTGASDHTLRRLTLSLTLPVSGTLATLAGGAKSAAISIVLGYSDVNQRQTVTAPTSTKPYSQFLARLKSLITAVETQVATSALGGATSGSGASGPATSTTQAGASTTGAYGSYSKCVAQAGNDIAKLQKCQAKLPG